MRIASRQQNISRSEVRHLVQLITGLISVSPALAHGTGGVPMGVQTGPVAFGGGNPAQAQSKGGAGSPSYSSGSSSFSSGSPSFSAGSIGLAGSRVTSVLNTRIGINGHALKSGFPGSWLISPAVSGNAGKSLLPVSSVTSAASMPNGGYNFDLSSGTANILLGSDIFHGKSSVSITVGDSIQTFRAGQQVTAAEYIAINEVVSGGKQTLVVDSQGAATGGTFALNQSLAKNVDNLTIPQAVTALDNISGKNSVVGISGDLLNYGSIYGIGKTNSAGTISAVEIVNEAGGVISTSLPSSLAANSGAGKASVDLTLSAGNNLSNSGSISSSGALTLATSSGAITNNGAGAGGSTATISASKDINLSAGSGYLSNAGLISSNHGNINVSTPLPATDININGSGGVFSAQNGNINVRTASYVGSNNINMLGGNYFSNNLNLYSGTGDIEGTIGQVSGNLNSFANVEHINADSQTLVLGNNTINGDPTFVNVGGSIVINGANSFTEDVAILAAGDITSSAFGTITAQSAAPFGGSGFNVTMVAGAAITVSPGIGGENEASAILSGGTTTPNGPIVAGQTATVNFSAGNGGNINLAPSAGATVINTSSDALFGGNGGSVTLAARANGSTGGSVLLDPLSTINMSGSGSGTGGTLTVYAGGNPAAPAATIQLGTVKANGGTGVFGGSGGNAGLVLLNDQQPFGSSGANVKFNNTGDIMTGGPISGNGGVPTNAGIQVQNIDAIGGGGAGGNLGSAGGNGGNGGFVLISAGALVVVNGNILTYGGGGGGGANSSLVGAGFNGGKGGSGGAVNVVIGGSNSGTITVSGIIDTSGGGGGGGSSGNPIGGAGGLGGESGGVQIQNAITTTVAQIWILDGGNGGTGSTQQAGGGGGSLGGGGGGGADFIDFNGGGGGGGFLGGGGGGANALGACQAGGGGGSIAGGAGNDGAGAGAFLAGGAVCNGNAGGFIGDGGEPTGVGQALGVPNNAGVAGFGSPLTVAFQNGGLNISGLAGTNSQIIISPNSFTMVPFAILGGEVVLGNDAGITNNGGVVGTTSLTLTTSQLVNTSSLIGSTMLINEFNDPNIIITNNGSIIANGGSPNSSGSVTISGNPASGNVFIGSEQAGPIGLIQSTGTGANAGVFIKTTPFNLTDSNQVIFYGNQNFSGPTTITASGVNQSVVIESGATVNCDSELTVKTPLLNLAGILAASPLFFDAPVTPSVPAGGGTIVNLSGDVNLYSSVFTNGQSLSILASGSINGTGCAFIEAGSLSGTTGNVLLVAGYNVSPASGQATSINSQTTYTLGSPSSGGSINLPGVVISTESLASGGQSGSIAAIANGGSVNIGTVVTAAGGSGSVAGSVLIIGETGVNLGSLLSLANGGTSGSAQVFCAKPSVQTQVVVQNGNLIQGSFGVVPSALVGNITIGGSGSGVDSGGASLTLNATGSVNVVDSSANPINLSNCAAGSTFQLSATGAASIIGGVSIPAATLSLSATSGSIGSLAIGGQISTNASSVSATASAAGKLIDITDTNTGAVTLNTLQSAGDALFTSSASTLTVNGASGTIVIIETTAASNGNIILAGSVSSTAGLLVNAGGAGNITQTAGVLSVTGGSALLGLVSTSGNIGANGAAIVSNAPLIGATTSGDVYLKNIAVSGMTTLETSQGNIFQLTSTSGLTLDSQGTTPALASNVITLTAQGVNGTIALNFSSGTLSQVITGAAGVSSNASSVVLNAQNSIFDNVNNGSTIQTNVLVLNAGNLIGGSIFSPVNTNATSLTINGTNAAYVTDQSNTTVTLNASSVASGQTLQVQASNSGMTVSGPLTGGSINLFAGGTGNLFINGNITTGTAILGVSTMSAAVIVNNATSVVGSGQVSVNSCNLDLIGTGTIIGNPLVMNCVGGGAGTIANSQGDVNLTSSLVENGAGLAIIASGNINASGPITLDLSNANTAVNNGSGGNLSIIAGFKLLAANRWTGWSKQHSLHHD